MDNPENVHDLNYYQKGKPKEYKSLATVARLLIIIWGVIVFIMGLSLVEMANSNDHDHGMAGFYSMVLGTIFSFIGILIAVLIVISFHRSKKISWTSAALFFGFATCLVFFIALFIIGAVGFVLCITALSLLILSKTQGVYNL